MKRNVDLDWKQQLVLGMAGFLLTTNANAIGWCPTSSDYQITCNSCSRELTCDLNGLGIRILGNNVTLDGRLHSINYSPSHGIFVSGYGTTIKNININNSGSNGINFEYLGPTISSTSYVDHVNIDASSNHGVMQVSHNPLQITYSQIMHSVGFQISCSSSPNLDLRNSSVRDGYSYGYIANGSGYNSWILSNAIKGNSSAGIDLDGTSGIVVNTDTLDQNGSYGIYMHNVNGSVKSNRGHMNGAFDCWEDHSIPVSIATSGNSWGTYSGTGCGP